MFGSRHAHCVWSSGHGSQQEKHIVMTSCKRSKGEEVGAGGKRDGVSRGEEEDDNEEDHEEGAAPFEIQSDDVYYIAI